MKKALIFLIVLFSGWRLYAQVLNSNHLDLLANEEIFDMTYVPALSQYMIVGNFTSINGQACSKVAFVNEDGSLSTTVLPWTINGTVFTCEVLGTNIFLGGNFTTIGATTRNSLAKITFTTSPSVAFTLNSWTPFTAGQTVHDLLLNGTTFIVAGDFYSISNASGTAFTRDCLAAFSSAGSITPTFSSGGIVHAGGDVERLNVEKTATGYLVSGYQLQYGALPVVAAIQFDFAGNYLHQITYSDGFNNTQGRDITVLNDSLVVLERYYSGLALKTYVYNPQTPATGTDVLTSGNTCYVGTATQGYGIETYQGDLIFFDDNASAASGTLSRGSVDFSGAYTQTTCTPVTMTGGNFNPSLSEHVKVVRNKLILSTPTLTTVNGQSRTRAALFCLEPENAQPFTVFDTTICSGNVKTYTIPTSLYAQGYRWSYSGTGVHYSTTANPFPQVLNGSVKLHSTTGNSINLHYQSTITSGILKVEPYYVCNVGDTLFSKPQLLNIHTVAPPDLTLIEDTMSFNCLTDTLILAGQSSVGAVSWQWAYPNLLTPVGSNDSLTIFGSGSPSVIYPNGMYYVAITEPVNGCKSTDSIFVTEDFVPPVISQDSVFSVPPDFKCSTTQMQLFASAGEATIYWTTATDTLTQLPNPHTIYSTSDLNFIAFATSNANGCKAQQAFQVTQNDTTFIRGNLPLHPWFPAALVTDTINCFSTNTNVTCGVDPTDPNAAAGTAWWSQTGSTSLNLTETDSLGMDALNHTKIWQFVTLNANNDCYDTSEVVILFDLDRPFVVNYAAPSTLNCSVDTMTLVHPLTGGAVTESWLDASGNPTGSNSVFVNATGAYVYLVTYTQNGCTSADTVSVLQTNELLLTSNDTLVCPGIPFTVGTTILNNAETPTYLWSNGANTSTATGTGGVDTEMSVIVTTPSGCTGYDTIQVSITAPIQITTAGFMSCGAASGSLQITNASGGAGNYLYSLDGITFHSSPLFDSLSEGNYTIYVKDALGCVYAFYDTLDATASAPAMDFLVSTYSGFGDTLAIVNTTLFAGFDSTNWVFPAGTIVFQNSDSLALIQLPDTGWFEITLLGYDDTCQFTLTKGVYSGEVSPNYQTNYNSVKIQSLVVFPNPTSGTFTVDVLFGTAQNYSVVVTNDLSQPVPGMQQTGFGTSASLPFTFPVGTSPGAYHVHVVSDYDARQFTLILN